MALVVGACSGGRGAVASFEPAEFRSVARNEQVHRLTFKVSNKVIPMVSRQMPNDDLFGRERSETVMHPNAQVTNASVSGGQFGVSLRAAQETAEGWVGWTGAQPQFTDNSVVLIVPGSSPTPGAITTLYAPTTHRSGSCVEVGTRYDQAPNATYANTALYVYDFCKPIPQESQPGTFFYPLNASQLKKYDMRGGASQPSSYGIAELLQNNGKDVVLISNPSDNDWDIFYSTSGTPSEYGSDADGWSMFETKYGLQLCPQVWPGMAIAFSLEYLYNLPTPGPNPPLYTPAPTPSPIVTSTADGYLYDIVGGRNPSGSDFATKTIGICGTPTGHGGYYYVNSVGQSADWEVFSELDNGQ